MALMIPPELQWLEWVAGSDWPAGNEDKMWAMGDALEEIAKRIRREGIPALERNLDALAVGYPEGVGREQIDKQLKNLRNGKDGLDQLAKYFESLGGSADKFGTELNSAKWNGIISLGFLAAELAWAALAGPGAPFAQASAIAATRAAFNFLGNQLLRMIGRIVGRVITNAVAKRVVQRIAYEVIQEAIVEVVQGTVQELAVQGINIAGGHQNGIDWGAVGKNAALSALAGGVGGGVGFGLGKLVGGTPLGGQRGWRGALGGGIVGLGAGAGGAFAAMAATGNFDPRMLTGGMLGGVGPSAIYGRRFGAGVDFSGRPMSDSISQQSGFASPDSGASNGAAQNGASPSGQNGASPTGDGSTPPASNGGNSPAGGQQAAAAPSSGASQAAPQGAPQAAPSHQAAPSDSSVDTGSDHDSGGEPVTHNAPSRDGDSSAPPSLDQGTSPSQDLPGTDPAGIGPNQHAGQPITTNPGIQNAGPGFVGGTDVGGLGGIDPNAGTPVGISEDTAVAPSTEPGTPPAADPNAASAAGPNTGSAVGPIGTGPSTAPPATGANPATGDSRVGQPTAPTVPTGDLTAHVPENGSPTVDVTPSVDAPPSTDAQPGATDSSPPGASTTGAGLADPATTPQQMAGPEGVVPGQSTGVTVPTTPTGDADANTAPVASEVAPETPTNPDGSAIPVDPATGMAAAASIPAVLSHISSPATNSAPSRGPGASERFGTPHVPSRADTSEPGPRTETPARQPSPNNDGASDFRPPIPPPAPPLAGLTDVSHGPDRTSLGSDPTTSRVHANLGSDGHFNLIVHADADGNPTVNGRPVDAQTIANAVRQNDNYTEGTPVRMVSCNTGLNPNLVIDIANRLGAPVTAPTDAAGVPNKPNSPVHVRNNGDWVTHHPSSTGRPPTITPGEPMPQTAGRPDGETAPDIDYMANNPTPPPQGPDPNFGPDRQLPGYQPPAAINGPDVAMNKDQLKFMRRPYDDTGALKPTPFQPDTRYVQDVGGKKTVIVTDGSGKPVYVETWGSRDKDGNTGPNSKIRYNPFLRHALPDTTYRVNDDFMLRTDEFGRVVEGYHRQLSIVDAGDRTRSEAQQRAFNQLRGTITGGNTDAGHTFRDMFGSPSELLFYTAQRSTVNQGGGDFFIMEDGIRALLQAHMNDNPPGRVEYSIVIEYDVDPTGTGKLPVNDERVPLKYKVIYRLVGGTWIREVIDNV